MQKNLSTNPYDVLGISSSASESEITKAFAMAMKQRKYPPDVIAKARKSLMNPQQRIIADYLRPNLPTIKRFKHQKFSSLENSEITLELLPKFENFEHLLETINHDSQLDKRLGKTLFSSSPIKFEYSTSIEP